MCWKPEPDRLATYLAEVDADDCQVGDVDDSVAVDVRVSVPFRRARCRTKCHGYRHEVSYVDFAIIVHVRKDMGEFCDLYSFGVRETLGVAIDYGYTHIGD